MRDEPFWVRHAVREYLMGVLLVEDQVAEKERQAPEQRAVDEVGGPKSSFHWDPVRKAKRRKMIREMRGGH